MTEDPRWPRAGTWLAESTSRLVTSGQQPVFGLLGVPAHETSLSATNAHLTPQAVREALNRYSTWSHSQQVDLRELAAFDLGDIEAPDGPEGEARTMSALSSWPGRLLIALGGDNSITYAVATGLRATGLVTLDAHHDLRDGISNGSPVQRLLADGFDGTRIVQIGIGDFTNSQDYARRAHEHGITVIDRDQVEDLGIDAVMARAIEIASGPDRGPVHVDLDVDVCDRSVAPACPASTPGGLTAHQLRRAARAAGRAPSVVGIDLTEVDAEADAPDGRTVRLVALCVLEAAAGMCRRS
ncbi:MAG: arginase family protein [Actinobacteria bacterium]|nr:arginase family protein [Actinomycetota bacterium]